MRKHPRSFDEHCTPLKSSIDFVLVTFVLAKFSYKFRYRDNRISEHEFRISNEIFSTARRMYSNLHRCQVRGMIDGAVVCFDGSQKSQPVERDERYRNETTRRRMRRNEHRWKGYEGRDAPASSMRGQSTMKRERRDATFQKISTALRLPPRLSPRVAFYQDILQKNGQKEGRTPRTRDNSLPRFPYFTAWQRDKVKNTITQVSQTVEKERKEKKTENPPSTLASGTLVWKYHFICPRARNAIS